MPSLSGNGKPPFRKDDEPDRARFSKTRMSGGQGQPQSHHPPRVVKGRSSLAARSASRVCEPQMPPEANVSGLSDEERNILLISLHRLCEQLEKDKLRILEKKESAEALVETGRTIFGDFEVVCDFCREIKPCVDFKHMKPNGDQALACIDCSLRMADGNWFHCQTISDTINISDDIISRVIKSLPLHWASENGLLNICRILTENRAKVNLQDKDQNSPLHYAARSNNVEICQLLLDKGAQLDLLDQEKRSALHWASQKGFVEICCLLTEKGANVNLLDEDKNSPLHYAARRNNAKICHLLLDKGAQLDLLDQKKRSALHWASEYEFVEVCCLLTEKGANVNLLDEKSTFCCVCRQS